MGTTSLKKQPRNLRILSFLMSTIAIGVALTSAYTYYSMIKHNTLHRVHKEVEKNLNVLGSHIETQISWAKKTVHTLSKNNDIVYLLSNQNTTNLKRANAVLDTYAQTIQAEACYLIDRYGHTIASSNRKEKTSFVGKNYLFRPYFKQAINSIPSLYMALGTVSNRRGIYFSHPVYREGQAWPLGVVVIKTSVEPIQQNFQKEYDGILLFSDPQGVIFISNKQDLLYHLLWELPPKKIDQIIESRQFGKGPFKWTGMKKTDTSQVISQSNETYHFHQYNIQSANDFQLIYLHSEKMVSNKYLHPINKSVGLTILIILACFITIVLFLTFKIKNEINLRSRAEKENKELIDELQDSLANVKQLSGLLPICASCKSIRDDHGYWSQIESYIHTHSEAQFSHGICPDCAKKLYPDLDV